MSDCSGNFPPPPESRVCPGAFGKKVSAARVVACGALGGFVWNGLAGDSEAKWSGCVGK